MKFMPSHEKTLCFLVSSHLYPRSALYIIWVALRCRLDFAQLAIAIGVITQPTTSAPVASTVNCPTSFRHWTAAPFDQSFLLSLTAPFQFTVLSSCGGKTPSEISSLAPTREDDGFRARDCRPGENVRELRTRCYGILNKTQF